MTGWIAPSLLLASALAAAPLTAADDRAPPAADRVPPADGGQPPDAELLLFLSDWEDEQGNWQDPMQYDDPRWAALDRPQVKDDED